MKKPMTLYELNALVKVTLEAGIPDEYWVEAEISESREVRGHCYLELIQKDDRNNTPVAKASAKCWASTWQLVKPHFERVTGQRLHTGMKVLLRVYAQFHENYGFSWIVTDIDPTFTIGDMARKRQEIVRRLKEEGVFGLQKELRLPLFCQHIAVISSEQAAGYGDFVNQLEGNDYGFRFHPRLFPAVMQGEGVEQSIIAALESIYASSLEADGQQPFDCVVIIRGGGATSDLSGFDTLALAENVANFPLPVITGIGHERDESVLDMVSHIRVKTPTAAAALLIDNLKAVLDTVDDAERRMKNVVTLLKTHQEARCDRLQQQLYSAVVRRLQDERHRLSLMEQNIRPLAERRLLRENHRLEMATQKLEAMDPALLLKRGYSITLFNGRALRDASALKPGDEIVTRLEKGSVRSVVSEK